MQMPIDANTDAKNGRSKNHGINGTIWLSATKYKTNTNTKTMANASTKCWCKKCPVKHHNIKGTIWLSLNKTSNANTKTNANKYANTFAKAARSKTFDIKRPIWPSGNNGETGFTTSDVAICRQASGKKCSELISRVIVSKYSFQQYLINLDKEWIQLLQCLLSRLYADVIYNGL